MAGAILCNKYVILKPYSSEIGVSLQFVEIHKAFVEAILAEILPKGRNEVYAWFIRNYIARPGTSLRAIRSEPRPNWLARCWSSS